MKIKIYQINRDRDKNFVKFLHYKHLDNFQETKEINASIYDEVFRGDVDCEKLEDVYRRFNTEGHPLHRGHSLSVSDIVVTKDGAYYCDSVGFLKVDLIRNSGSICAEPELLCLVKDMPAFIRFDIRLLQICSRQRRRFRIFLRYWATATSM